MRTLEIPTEYKEEKIVNKECPRCLTYKPFTDFKDDAAFEDEYDNICTECREVNYPHKPPTPKQRAVVLTRLRAKLTGVVKSSNKSNYFIDLIGCTHIELRDHLEAQFTEGMTWDNHGAAGWHIDHIRPCASFDIVDTVQQFECFHYSNLQPLWAADNMEKGAKWDGYAPEDTHKWDEIDEFMRNLK